MSSPSLTKIALIGIDCDGEALTSWRQSMQQCGLEVYYEPAKPDLLRLRGILMAAFGDPRFDVISVCGGSKPVWWHQLQAQVMSFQQMQLDLFPQQAAACLLEAKSAEERGSLLLRCFGLGQRDGRMILSLPGPPQDAHLLFERLLWPNWADLSEWCRG